MYAIPAMSRIAPYSAVGAAAKWFSPNQPVANGISDSQNRRCRFAYMIAAVTFSTECSMWWWLFQ